MCMEGKSLLLIIDPLKLRIVVVYQAVYRIFERVTLHLEGNRAIERRMCMLIVRFKESKGYSMIHENQTHRKTHSKQASRVT